MLKNLNILVVDDEEIMRSLFTDILRDEGYKVTTVNNGKEAVERVKGEFFDLAFVDIHMPIMDGMKTLQLLREITPKTAVVMTDSTPDYITEVKNQGALTCIRKPFNIREVREVTNKITRGCHESRSSL